MVLESLPQSRSKSILIYLATLIGLLFTAFSHLDYAADGIWNITLPTLMDMFPIFFLFVAIFLLGIAVVVTFTSNLTGAKVAFVASILAWIYYILVVCAMALAFSVAPFLTTRGILIFVIPVLLLVATTWYSRQIVTTLRKSSL